jgi:hypothetical protein
MKLAHDIKHERHIIKIDTFLKYLFESEYAHLVK